jgi:hypothetical protein
VPVPTTPYSLLIKSLGFAVDPEPTKGDVVEVTSDVPVPNTPPRVVESAGVVESAVVVELLPVPAPPVASKPAIPVLPVSALVPVPVSVPVDEPVVVSVISLSSVVAY